MRKFFLSIIFLLILSACAFADALLYRGTLNMGAVPSLGNTDSVSIEDAGKLLGFTSSKSGEELILRRGNIHLRVVIDSAAAWRGFSIIPLYSAPFVQDGKFWLDSLSAAALFQSSVGSAVTDRLKFVKSTGSLNTTTAIAQNTSRRDIEFGSFDDDTIMPARTQNAATNASSSASATITAATTAAIAEASAKAVSKKAVAVAPTPMPTITTAKAEASTPAPTPIVTATPAPVPAVTATPAPAPTVTATAATAIPTPAPKPAPTVTATPLPTPTVTVAAASTQETPPTPKEEIKTTKSRPKYETFKPNAKKTERGETYSGTIQGIRWTSTEGAHKKIRAVVTTDEDADPQVFMQDGKLHALFASSLESSSGVESPFSNIKAELKRNANGIELIFSPTDITKAEKLVLSSPRRIAFEFFYPSEINIVRTVPEAAQTSDTIIAKTPEQPKSTPSAPKDPIINANPQPKQQVQVPQTTITIPTTPVNPNQRRLANAGKKTIVIDAGHGGKDPGASDNGVVEKNVNLAIALELERELLARGFNVVMTRRTDVYLKLQERTDIANAVNADLFVSFHVNALPSKKSASGFEIYIMALPTDKDAMNLAKVENREYVEGKGFDTENVDRRTELLLHILGDMQQNNKISESTEFAGALYNAGAMSGLPMRRVAQAPFFVLRGAGMPAVLIEVGFVTNPQEAVQLTQKIYQSKIAQAMASGIVRYLN